MTITNHISDAHKTNRKTVLALIVVSRNCGKRGHQTKKDLAKKKIAHTSGEDNVDYASFEFFPSIIDWIACDTWLLLRRSQWSKSPCAIYSIINNRGSDAVQQPRKLNTFWCLPISFMSLISFINSLLCSSFAFSREKKYILISHDNKHWKQYYEQLHHVFSKDYYNTRNLSFMWFKNLKGEHPI